MNSGGGLHYNGSERQLAALPSVPRRRSPDLIVRVARTLYEYACLYAGLLYVGVVGLVYSTLCSIVHLFVRGPRVAYAARRVAGMLWRIFFALMRTIGIVHVDLSPLQALRGRCVIIAPNHPSLLDAVLVISQVPEVGCIMKSSIWDNPILGGAARLMGYIRNDAPLSMLRQARHDLEAGIPLLVFPEGTRTRQRPVNEFKGGFALLAKQAAVPIQTVFIETDSPFLGKTWPLLRKPVFPVVFRVRLGKSFTVEGDVHAFLTRLNAYFREELMERPAAPAPQQPANATSPGAAVH
jgi:1-acyl-sn-glycerol-3-phosphate acyltransferase